MTFKTIFTAAAVTLVGTSAFSQDVGDVSVGVGVSTFGLNVEAGYQVTPQLRVRGALMGGLSADFEETEDGDSVEGEFDLGGAAVLADYYPTQSGWRVSGGLFLSNTELDADGTVDISGTSTNATLSADFANEISPMITTGYDWEFAQGWMFSSELGVVFNGGIDVTVTGEDATAQNEIDNDPDIQDAIDDAADITALPYLSLGVTYRF